MNRTVILGAFVVILAGLGYYQFSYKPAQEAAMVAEAEKKAAEAAAATEAAAAEAAKKAEEEAAAAAAAATEAATATTEAVTEGTEAATDAATEAADAVTTGAAALDPATFDADAVIALIDGSTVDDATKATLKTAVEAARTNPALVADTVAQVRTALGL